MNDLQKAAGVATVALGASQALTPQFAAKVFGLDELDGQARWLARLLGVANLGFGALALDERTHETTRAVTYGVLAGNAAVTLGGVRSGSLPSRTALMVLGFLGALAAVETLTS